MRIRTACVGACLAGLLLVGGCGNQKADPIPQVTKTPSASPVGETAQDEYHAALARFTEYEKVSEPVWAAGKYTPAAKALLAKYWSVTGPRVVPATNQPIADASLRQADANGLETKGLPRVLSSKPVSVDSTQVVIKQCANYTSTTLFHNGKRLGPGLPSGGRLITLERQSDADPWFLVSVDDFSKKADAGC